MELCSIASGSSGNCIYVRSNRSHILVDAGVSAKRIESGLNDLEVTGHDIDGICITHEHSDHIQGLGVLARRYHIPMYATSGTIDAIKRIKSLGNIDESLFHVINTEEDFMIGDIKVSAIDTWHDAANPCCYSFVKGNDKISIATDLGDFNDNLVYKLSDSDILFIEANHDIRMLQVGPYPYYLKQRILSDKGHLSNDRSGEFIYKLLNDHVKGIFLAHLSKENNYEELAYETVKQAISDNPFTKDVRDFRLQVAKRSECSPILSTDQGEHRI